MLHIILTTFWVFIHEESYNSISDSAFSIGFTFIWIFIEGFYMAVWGTTPGKKLLKIEVITAEGKRIDKYTGFRRARLIWIRGMGLGIGIVQLVANIWGYKTLIKNRITTWDQDLGLIVVHNKVGVLRLMIPPLLLIGLVAFTFADRF